MSKSLVLGAVAGAVIVALAGGYYFGVKTAKGQTPNVIAKVVNDGNAVSQQYFDGSWLIKSEKDESADSFSGDRYKIKLISKDDNKEYVTITGDNSYGLTSVTTDYKVKFADADDPDTKAFLSKLEQSISGTSTFSAFGKKLSSVISLADNKFEVSDGSIEWGKAEFSASDVDVENPQLANYSGFFEGLKINSKDDSAPLAINFESLKYDFDDSKAEVGLKSFNFKFADQLIALNGFKFDVKNKVDLSQKKASVEFGTDLGNLDLVKVLPEIGDLKIENFKFDLQLNNLNAAGFLDKCKLNNTREDWYKISSCASGLNEADLTSASLVTVNNSSGLIKIDSKVNASAINLDFNYKVDGEAKNVFEILKLIKLNASLKFDKSLFDNVPALGELKSFAAPYVVDKGDKFEAVFDCDGAKCNLNGKKFF